MLLRILFSCVIVLLITVLLLFFFNKTDSNQRLYEKQSLYDFNETLQNLEIAISEHNYRVIHRSHIGQAIRDRGETDFPLSTIVNFCNITYAKEMIEIRQELINEMPCFIAVREQNEHVIVSTKLMDISSGERTEQNFSKKINQNLIDIITSTVE